MLRGGEMPQMIETWKNNPKNMIVFTENNFDHEKGLQPYFPMRMKVINIPIDGPLTDSQGKLIFHIFFLFFFIKLFLFLIN